MEAYAYQVIGNLPVQAIDVGLVLRVLEPVWTEKTDTASRVRGRVEAVLDLATAHGYRKGENPARWKGHLENLLPKRSKIACIEHHAALPYSAVAALLDELRQRESSAARALEFLIVTATRTAVPVRCSAPVGARSTSPRVSGRSRPIA